MLCSFLLAPYNNLGLALGEVSGLCDCLQRNVASAEQRALGLHAHSVDSIGSRTRKVLV